MRVMMPGVALAVLAAPLAAQAPAPDQVELLTWQGAVNANSAGAYRLYLDRYPNGAFAGLARENLDRPAPDTAAATPVLTAPLPTPPPVLASPPPPPLCATAIATAAPDRSGPPLPDVAIPPAELTAYRDAVAVHRFARWREFLSAFPAGACFAEVNYVMAPRIARHQQFVATPAAGERESVWIGGGAAGIVTQDDYPPAAMRAGQQGRVGVRLEIAEDGRVDDCNVTESSGSEPLDATTCRIFIRRARFDPARDAKGLPIVSLRPQRITWTLPEYLPKK